MSVGSDVGGLVERYTPPGIQQLRLRITRLSSVVYEVTMGEGYGAIETWTRDSDPTWRTP